MAPCNRCQFGGMKITVLIIISLLSLCEAKEKQTLRLGFIEYSGLIPAIEIALETIEADETLPFRLKYTYNDSMVSIYVAMHG